MKTFTHSYSECLHVSLHLKGAWRSDGRKDGGGGGVREGEVKWYVGILIVLLLSKSLHVRYRALQHQKHLLTLCNCIRPCIRLSSLFDYLFFPPSISHQIYSTELSVSGKEVSVFRPWVSCSSHRPWPSLSMLWHRLQRDTHTLTNTRMHNHPGLASFSHNSGLLVCLQVHPL